MFELFGFFLFSGLLTVHLSLGLSLLELFFPMRPAWNKNLASEKSAKDEEDEEFVWPNIFTPMQQPNLTQG